MFQVYFIKRYSDDGKGAALYLAYNLIAKAKTIHTLSSKEAIWTSSQRRGGTEPRAQLPPPRRGSARAKASQWARGGRSPLPKAKAGATGFQPVRTRLGVSLQKPHLLRACLRDLGWRWACKNTIVLPCLRDIMVGGEPAKTPSVIPSFPTHGVCAFKVLSCCSPENKVVTKDYLVLIPSSG